jgi:hypothetical protein
MTLKHVEYVARDLRGEDREVIRQYDEEYSKKEPVTVFPEIFIKGTKVFHLRKGKHDTLNRY